MPVIPSRIISSVFYLYASTEEARKGINPGGTGFIVEYGGFLTESSGFHFYGVTNWHVACQRGFSIIRLNTKDGKTDIIELGPEDWEFIPSGPDVAIVPLSFSANHDVSTISIYDFVRPPDPRGGPLMVEVGDDAFMLGLFIDHAGVATNVPSARFGNVSMLPNAAAPIKQPSGYLGESFVLDMHSRTGFSGSPVFMYRTFGSDLTETWGHEFRRIEFNEFGGRMETKSVFRFLGIHWGQFPETWELRRREEIQESRKDYLILEGAYVEGMSGMTCVVPAWEISRVLELPQLNRLREQGTKRDTD